ncbi:MAG: DUF4350 domain-containing protein [Kofleriaceae bacterium]
MIGRLVVIVAVVLALAGRAGADDAPPLADYDPTSSAWNGMATFSKLASGLGYEVFPVGTLEWSDLDAEDILVLVYPLQRVEPSRLAAFIGAGGNVIVADDFGAAAPALSRLGLLRAEVNTAVASRYYRSLPYAPIATPMAPSHPIARGVSEVVTNHPAVLSQVTGATAVIGFDGGGAVVVAGERGTGRFIVVSDPSILINRMAQFPGNLTLAVNMLRWLDRGGRARRVVLLRGDVPMYGEPRPFIDDANLSSVGRSLIGVNRWLESRNEWLLTPTAMRVVGALVAVLLAALALAAMPPWRRRVMDGTWLGPAARVRTDHPATLVAAADAGRPALQVPAAVLRDSVNHALARALGLVDPLGQLPARELVTRISDGYGRDAGALVARLSPRLRDLPHRTDAALGRRLRKVDLRVLTDLHADAQALYRLLGEPTPAAGRARPLEP